MMYGIKVYLFVLQFLIKIVQLTLKSYERNILPLFEFYETMHRGMEKKS